MTPMIGRRMWIRRKHYVLGGSKRKTKRREQRALQRQLRTVGDHG